MLVTDLIRKKKLGGALSREEIYFFVQGFTKGEIPDYQISPLLMAIWFQGMTEQETAWLTEAFVHSGEVMDLSDIPGIKVDKHSTGGVGDKISLIVLPVVASLGIPVAKLSGRGLGHTGGTIDKLESIPGFSTDISLSRFKKLVQETGIAIAGQTVELTPADKKFYALRDVTETVDSIPLIASSIMSKKIASGSDAIVLDVKSGEGAFMKDLAGSRQLAETMVRIGNSLGRRTVAVITDMNQPLGHAVGNANEVVEAMEVLKGRKIPGLYEVALEIASYMVWLGGAAENKNVAAEMVGSVLHSGKALESFRDLIKNQGGDPMVTEDYSRLPQAANHLEIKADRAGVIHNIQAREIGYAAMHLGAGRHKKGDMLDYGAGIELVRLVGEQVEKGDVLCILHYNEISPEEAMRLAKSAFIIESGKREHEHYILDVVSE